MQYDFDSSYDRVLCDWYSNFSFEFCFISLQSKTYIYSTIQDTLLHKQTKQNEIGNKLPKILVIIAERKLKYVISEV